MQKPTPMLRQYLDIKKRYPGTILFFRLGDFYEMFNEDAVTGSRELDITLTARQKNSESPIPMCGVPHHAAANYISKLVRKGYRVAICEQTEDASDAKKLVKRDVVRIITPGTAIDEQLVERDEPVYLASIAGRERRFGIAFLDISTGEFSGACFEGADAFHTVFEEIEGLSPKELLYPRSLASLVEAGFGRFGAGAPQEGLFPDRASTSASASITLTQLVDSQYSYEDCGRLLKTQFGVKTLTGFGLDDKEEAVCAAGACLRYALETQKADAKHVGSLAFSERSDHMVLDSLTLRNLEIVRSRDPEKSKRNTLLGVIDETVTGMGARQLRSWMLRPSFKLTEINERLGAVAELSDTIFRQSVRYLLKEIADLERLVGRLNLGTATPRDLLAIRDSLALLPEIRTSLSDARSILLGALRDNMHELRGIHSLLEDAVSDDAPALVSDGGVIKEGFDAELDELRELAKSGKQTIAGFEKRERERTGISALHVKFNNVFGYFIEVSKANLGKVPEAYERRQTLTNAERFTTPELKEWESKVLGAEERIREVETALFRRVRASVTDETRKLQATARALAAVDALAGLAETAAYRNFTRPELHEGDEMSVRGGRHPVVEASAGEPFVPNDVFMNNSSDRLLVITGANMGGKSTVLRQTALIQILAQAGSFVPATAARLPLVDRIWTRVGASDDLASGRSTFMVEMTEAASILRGATSRSLVLLDEIGRGTSTFDGLAIAWAVAEYLHDDPEHTPKTLFATHYHELTELAENLPGAKNYQLSAVESDGSIVFLHKLEKGSASKSYGIAVAKLAGLPGSVIARAKAVLEKLEKYEIAVFSDERIAMGKGLEAAVGSAHGQKAATQVSLFEIANENALSGLRELDPETASEDQLREAVRNAKKKIV